MCSSDLRPGQRTLLGNVADQEGTDLVFLGEPEDLVGDLADLADGAGARRQLGGEDRLDRVHDKHPGPDALGLGQDAVQVGLGQEIKISVR